MSTVNIKKLGNLVDLKSLNLSKAIFMKKIILVNLVALSMFFGCTKDSDVSTLPSNIDDNLVTELRCNESALPSNGKTYFWNLTSNGTAKIKINYLKRSGENNPVIFWQIADYYNSAGNFIPGGNFRRVYLYVQYKKPCGEIITISNDSEVSMPVGINNGWTTIVPGNNVTNRGLSFYRVLVRLKARVSTGQDAISPVFSFTPQTSN